MIDKNFKWQYPVTIIRVIDGDTIVVDIDLGLNIWIRNESIRLAGVNLPEIRGKERQLGLKAKAYVESYLKPGDKVLLISERYDPRGKYGRIVGTFSFNSYDHPVDPSLIIFDFAFHLVEQGYALPYDGMGPMPRFKDVLVENYPLKPQP